jgi:hypothetical protein
MVGWDVKTGGACNMFLAGEVATPVTEETTTPNEESKDVVPASTEETPGG